MQSIYKPTHFLALFFSFMLGFITPVFLFLVFWWSSIPFVKEVDIFKAAALGLIIGIVISIKGIKKWQTNIYRLNLAMLVSVYIFYMVGIFGFFMGVPVFNILPGIIAGAYIAAKNRNNGGEASLFRQQLLRVQWLNFFALLPFLAASAGLALTDVYTAANLKGMFRLSFEPTWAHISGLIITGALGLILLQYALTGFVASAVYGSEK